VVAATKGTPVMVKDIASVRLPGAGQGGEGNGEGEWWAARDHALRKTPGRDPAVKHKLKS
jgi:hypothetical protein